jgi:UPF0755 protein
VILREFLTPIRITTAAIVLAAVVVTLGGVFWLVSSPLTAVAQPREFTVQPGWGGGRIAAELKEAGLIRWAPAFIIIASWTETGDDLKAGTYALSPDMSTGEIVRMIAAGEALSSDITVTIPEGMNIWEIDELLTTQRLILQGSFARQYREREGSMFPDTYRFAAEVASTGYDFKNADIFADAFMRQFQRKAASYTDEQVIVASMLEKEAKSSGDMALVAGIMAKRQELGMLLQIDATVGYGWCLRRWLPMSSTANCDVTQAPIGTEIRTDGPYNTYTRTGLPVGPISNPGLKALEAAKNPRTSDYLYYLSTRDGSQLIYSKTLEEHNRNRSKYLGL